MPGTGNNEDHVWVKSDARMAALETQVTGIDRHMHAQMSEFSTRFSTLDAKIENHTAALAEKIESGLTALARQLTDRGSTKWNVIFTGLGVALTFAGMIGYQALSPIQSDIQLLKADYVPRREVERTLRDFEQREERQRTENEKRDDALQAWLRRIDNDRRQEAREETLRLQHENYDLRTDLRKSQANQKPPTN